ncbi:hypothetical protein A2U01_0108069, partial [Trifolium medium]|nr:hypothetical protein [Trifolium medium]
MAGDPSNNDGSGGGAMTLQTAVAEIQRLQAKVMTIEQERAKTAVEQ